MMKGFIIRTGELKKKANEPMHCCNKPAPFHYFSTHANAAAAAAAMKNYQRFPRVMCRPPANMPASFHFLHREKNINTAF